MWSSVRSEAALEAQLPLPILIRRMRRARRMRLRLDAARGRLTLTCPWRTSRKTALAWAVEQRDWIVDQIARSAPVQPFADGATLSIDGEVRMIRWDPASPRRVTMEPGLLRCGGSAEGVGRRIEAFLKQHALAVMSAEVAEFAAIASVHARAVSIGDPGSRWGSCSSDGRIRLSWRLIMAPPNVRRYVVAHEVAHLRHLDHGADFKELEQALVGSGLGAAKASLKRIGPDLRRLGRHPL